MEINVPRLSFAGHGAGDGPLLGARQRLEFRLSGEVLQDIHLPRNWNLWSETTGRGGLRGRQRRNRRAKLVLSIREGGGMLTRPLLNKILLDENLVKGLNDPEARVLIEWLVDR